MCVRIGVQLVVQRLDYGVASLGPAQRDQRRQAAFVDLDGYPVPRGFVVQPVGQFVELHFVQESVQVVDGFGWDAEWVAPQSQRLGGFGGRAPVVEEFLGQFGGGGVGAGGGCGEHFHQVL